jgi:GTPase
LIEKLSVSQKRVLLIHIKIPHSVYDSFSSVTEFQELAVSSGLEILDLINCSLHGKQSFSAKYLIGSGKLNEIANIVNQHEVNSVIFNYELTASQQKNLEKFLNCKVLDRTELILYIFAQRARTFEGKLQVELARLQHLSTRLVKVWTHLERQRGGVGLRSGPGEQQIEIDRRIIRKRIKKITESLEKIRKQRELHRRSRRKSMVPVVSLVGYTNSGKSTLFNLLTNSSVTVMDLPFVTLDPTLRSMFIPRVGKIILADTVGFIRDLPHHLIDAFKATLEEITCSDLLLHVIDVSDDNSIQNKGQVLQVLEQIGALHIPIIEVYNKTDLATTIFDGIKIDGDFHNNKSKLSTGIKFKVKISALHNLGINDLICAISNLMSKELIKCKVKLMPKDECIRIELLKLGTIKKERIDLITGECKLDIIIQKKSWEKLCNKFIDLPKLIVS